jgi:uncharacterized protein (TIRG00374 family)
MKRAAVTIVQIAVTLVIFYFLLRDPVKREQMSIALQAADRWWLLAGMLMYGVVELIAAWRWEVLLHVQGIFLSRARLVMLLLIGVFFNFFIPGGTGGDLVRAYYLIKEAPGKGPAAVLSVLIDRVVGLFALIFLGGGMIMFRWSWLTSTPQTRQLTLSALIVLGIATAAVGFAVILSGFGLVHRLPAKFPKREKLAELALALNQYGHAWQASLKAIISSVACNLGYFMVFYCAARAFQTAEQHVPSLIDMFAVLPVVNTLIALPIGMNGLGVREALFETFFHQLSGMSKGVAVLMSSTGFLLTAAWGVIGGVVYLFYRPSEHAKLRRIQTEIAAVEHEVAETEIALESSEEAVPVGSVREDPR